MWSTVATSSASRRGWLSGNTWTAMPILTRRVQAASADAMIPDQGTAINFYVTTLGLTRDPYIMTGTENMWINAGQQQFHMPTGKPEVVRGIVGFVIPDIEGLKMRLGAAREKLAGTKFMCAAEDK